MSRNPQALPFSPPLRPAVKTLTRKAVKTAAPKGKSVLRQLQDQGQDPGAARPSAATPSTESSKKAATIPPSTAPPSITATAEICSLAQRTRPSAPTTPAPARGQTKVAASAPNTASARPAAQESTQGQGLKDPYEVPSDNDAYDDIADRKARLAGVTTPEPRVGSAQRAAAIHRGSAGKKQPAAAARNTTPTAPAGRGAGATAEKTSPRTPNQKLKQRTSPNSADADTEADTEIITLSARNTPASRRRTLSQVEEGAQTILLSSGSQSPRDDESAPESDPAPGPATRSRIAAASASASVPVSVKALGKRSHHSINDHLDIIGPPIQPPPKTPSQQQQPKPIMIRHSRGVTPVYRRGEAETASGSSPPLPSAAATTPLPPSSSSSIPTPAVPPPEPEPEQQEKQERKRTVRQKTADVPVAEKTKTKTKQENVKQEKVKQEKKQQKKEEKEEEAMVMKTGTRTRAAARRSSGPASKVSPSAAVEHAKSQMEVKFDKKGQSVMVAATKLSLLHLIPSHSQTYSHLFRSELRRES